MINQPIDFYSQAPASPKRSPTAPLDSSVAITTPTATSSTTQSSSSSPKADIKETSSSNLESTTNATPVDDRYVPSSSTTAPPKALSDQTNQKLNEEKRNHSTYEDISDPEDDEQMQVVIKCCICDENIPPNSKSSSITKSNCHLYGLGPDDIKLGMEVCLNCKFKHILRECPIQSCKTAKRKVRRLKLLPHQWFDLSPDVKQSIAKELNIPLDVKKGCTRCVIRISRRIGAISPLLAYTRRSLQDSSQDWNENEINALKDGLSTKGKNWPEISSIIVTKSPEQCKDFYFNFKFKLDLNQYIENYWTKKGENLQASDSEDYWKDMSEDDTEATSSADERHEKSASDTASASSPLMKITNELVNDVVAKPPSVPNESNVPDNVNYENKLADLRVISTSQGSLKSDYDSSATVSADEGRGNCEEDLRNSPPSNKHPSRGNSAVSVYPIPNHVMFSQNPDRGIRSLGHNTLSIPDQPQPFVHGIRPMDIHQLQRPRLPFPVHSEPVPPKSSPSASCGLPSAIKTEKISPVSFPEEKPRFVRDLIYLAIERSFRSDNEPAKTTPLPLTPESTHSIPISTNQDRKNLTISSSSLPISSPFPIYPPSEIKKEMGNEPCKFSSTLKPPIQNEIRKRYDSQPTPPQAQPHYLVKPEGMPPVMRGYPMGYTPASLEPDNEVQDLSKKNRRSDDPGGYNSFPPSKREKFDPSSKNLMVDHKNSSRHLPLTPPPAHFHQLKRPPTVDLPLTNLSSETMGLSVGSSRGDGVFASSRNIDPSRVEAEGYHYIERPSSGPLPLHPPGSSPLLRLAIRSPMNKPPILTAPSMSHTPPLQQMMVGPPSNKNYPVPVSLQLSPKPAGIRDTRTAPIVSTAGSITQGTPIIMTQQQHGSLHFNQYGDARYEGLFRGLPPTHPKDSGSITLGTPVTQGPSKRNLESSSSPSLAPGSMPYRNQSVIKSAYTPNPGNFDPSSIDPYYRRMSPSSLPYPSPNQPPFHPSSLNYHLPEGHIKPGFQVESQSSSKQIMIDFNTSKQMQTSRKPWTGHPNEPNPHPSHLPPQPRTPVTMYPYPPGNIQQAHTPGGIPSPVLMSGVDHRHSNSSPNTSRSASGDHHSFSPTPEHWMKQVQRPGYPIVAMVRLHENFSMILIAIFSSTNIYSIFFP